MTGLRPSRILEDFCCLPSKSALVRIVSSWSVTHTPMCRLLGMSELLAWWWLTVDNTAVATRASADAVVASVDEFIVERP